MRERVAAWALVAGLTLGVASIHVYRLYEPYTFLIGDCPYYAQTALSILLDGDLDLRNQLRGGLEPHQRQVSLGARGEWYPKHPILMPLVTVPLVPLLGMKAFIVFNLLVLAALSVALYELARLAAGPAAAIGGSLGMIFGSFIILYDYNYSPDLFACVILTAAVHATLRERAGSAGLLAGLATFARTSNLFLVPITLAYTAWKRKSRGAILFIVAASLPLLAQAGLNFHMFGSPFTSPYMRILTLRNGEPAILSHLGDFNLPIWEGIRGQLLDPEKGLLFTAPVLLLAAPGFVPWLKRRRDQALLCFVLAEFLFLIFSSYRWWPTSHEGNRFLMPVLAFSAPALACSVEWILGRIRGLTRKKPAAA